LILAALLAVAPSAQPGEERNGEADYLLPAVTMKEDI
jgi:hypothetical protein